jgi:hypothetical protein
MSTITCYKISPRSAAYEGKLKKGGGSQASNAGWQSDLAWIYWRTGSARAEVEPTSKNEAREMVEKGRDILRQLKARTGLTAKQQEWLDSIEADLRKMKEKK